MKQSFKIFNDFSKGLNTDFNNINQDPNAIIEMDNFLINNNGTISKRKGLGVEGVGDSKITIPKSLKSKNVSTYLWKNVAKQTTDILVLQVGEKLYFYSYGSNIALGKLNSEVNIGDYLTSKRLVLEDIRITFAEIKGVLVCAHNQLTPFYLRYENGEIKDHAIDLTIRDYDGIEEDIELLDRPKSLTKEHLYNLYNQGWDSWAVYACFANNNFFPSNGDIPNQFYDSTIEYRASGLPVFKRAYVGKEIKRFTKSDEEFNKIAAIGNEAVEFVKTGKIDIGNPGTHDANDLGGFYRNLGGAYGADLIDFNKMKERRTDQEVPKGRAIKNVFDPADVTNLVSRPITEEPDTGINRNKYNRFHVVEKVLDVFYDSVNRKVRLVLELDKEHGLYGGFNQSASCVVNGKLGHYKELNQSKIGDGSTNRIFSYKVNEDISAITGITEYKLEKIDDLLLTDFKKEMDKRYGNSLLSRFSYTTTNSISFLCQNETDNPHDYKSIAYDNLVGGIQAIATSREAMNEEHLRAKNFYPGYLKVCCSYPLFSTTTKYSQTNNRLSREGTAGYYSTINAEGFLVPGSWDSHKNITFNTTQFDKQQVKRKTVFSEKITDIELKDSACTIEALSTKKCVLTIPISGFSSLPSDWLFNVSANGELLCYDDIYKSMKIKLSETLYDRMQDVYENIKRDEYASKKLDEEYKDNADYYSVVNVNTINNTKPYRSDDGVYRDISDESINVVLELNKPHLKELYVEDKSRNNWYKTINVIQGDFTSYSSNDLFENKKVLIPKKYRMYQSYSENSATSHWGEYSSDFMRHKAKDQVIKLKHYNDLPAYFRKYNIDIFRNGSKNVLTSSDINSCVVGKESNSYINRMAVNNSQIDYSNDSNHDIFCHTLLSYQFEGNAAVEKELADNGWLYGGRSTNVTGNLSPAGRPVLIKSLVMHPYSKSEYYSIPAYSSPAIAAKRPCVYDFIECYRSPMNLNMTKSVRKTIKEKYNVQFVGKKYISLGLTPNKTEVYTDIGELVTKDDPDKEMLLITERNGNSINIHELLNMKFSLNGTIPRSEITAKQRAYRAQWNWKMDGDGSQGDSTPVDPDNLKFEDVEEEFRTNCTATYSGRVFYGGINSNKYSNTIFYSKQITEDLDNQMSQCYTENDPTSKYLNSSLPTDGGYISINGAGEILEMKVVGFVLCVIATNGVWAISGSNGNFSATSHYVKKVSNVGCISPKSVSVINNSLVYVGEYAINMLQFNSLSADLTPNDITKNRINKLFETIPLSSKKYLTTVYDKVKGIIYFVYNSKESDLQNPDYDSAIVYNLSKDSFFKLSFNTASGYKIKNVFVNEFNHDDDIRIKFVCMNDTDVKFFELNDNNFLDFTNVGYSAVIKTSGQIAQSPINVLSGGQVITHLRNKVNTSCIANVDYDFGNTFKTSKPTEIYKDKPNEQIVYNKVMLRGEGHNLNLNYVSPAGKDCEILGFEFNFKMVIK